MRATFSSWRSVVEARRQAQFTLAGNALVAAGDAGDSLMRPSRSWALHSWLRASLEWMPFELWIGEKAGYFLL